ncbi:MAG: glycosyltransferase [Rhodobacteraceae bacterium]|nr:glycosyltransferase [Paracoccaceae bacterium]
MSEGKRRGWPPAGPEAARVADSDGGGGTFDPRPATLLLSLSVHLHEREGAFYLEDQACNGLRLWARHFERLIVVIPLDRAPPPPAWVPVAAHVGPELARIEFLTLPVAYRPDRFLRALPAGVAALTPAIRRADYLGFAIGGLMGDWGTVGAVIAHRLGLPFYVWTDRVESEVMRAAIRSAPSWRKRLLARLMHRPMAWMERYVIRRSELGLFHGRETFDAFAPWCRNPQVVHDIHIRKADHIDPARLAEKMAGAGSGPLRICYVGRADPMKGPGDWLDVLEALEREGIDFEATWLGDGSGLAAMRRRVEGGPLAARVRLPGFVRDRGAILEALRGAHLLMFCHKTPESPRCLIEALVSGTPIVGYDSAFPRELIERHGGGRLTPPGEVPALAGAVAGLARDRQELADLIGRAARDGARFDDETVFRHRAELIRTHLRRARPFDADTVAAPAGA